MTRNFIAKPAFVDLIRACAKSKDLYGGTTAHARVLKSGLLEQSSYIANALVSMYAKCGDLAKAKDLLVGLPVRDVFSWNALIAGYTQHGKGKEALYCFESMQYDGLSPSEVTYSCILKACGDLREAKKGVQIHDEIVRQGLLRKDVVLGSALVDMYAKCGLLAKAQQVLDELPVRDVVSWSALIAGYAQQGQGKEALNCLELMQGEGLSPNAVTFISALKACGSIGSFDKGQQIHDEIVKQKLLRNNTVLGNALVAMYAKCSALAKAQVVFDELPVQDVVSWSALIAGYVQQGQGHEALNCFERMQQKGHSPNIVTFTCALRACGNIGAVDKGDQIHDEIARQGLLGKDIMLDNALVDMYAKCGALEKARQVLQELPVRDVFSWSALIAGYVQQGQGQEALNCFDLMRREGLSPNAVIFTCMLRACGSIGAADKGKLIHDEIARQGLLGKDMLLGTALVDMYAKCGELAKARQLLEELSILDVVSWSALIAGYAQQGQGEEALKFFELMQHKNLSPNAVTFACALKACGCIGAADKGEQIHHEIVRKGLLENNIVLGNALVDMYSKCGAFTKAQQVLDKLPVGDVVSWSLLIAGYVQQGRGEEAFDCYRRMCRKGFYPNEVTFTYILKACCIMGAADKGEEIHNEIANQGLLEKDCVLGNALVGMYAKCGALEKAQRVLDELPVQDVVSWSTLIAGYAQQGQGQDAINCFEQMQHKGFSPDPVTLTSVLNACSHSGLVDEGQMYFANMSTKYGILPDSEHYTCMVDLYGRAGHFDKAVGVIQKMPSSGYLPVWSSLLAACRKWGDVPVGRWAFEHAVQVDKSDAAAYVCMANIYAAAGMQEDAENIEFMRVQNKACKKPGAHCV